jgi:hypothetical protein
MPECNNYRFLPGCFCHVDVGLALTFAFCSCDLSRRFAFDSACIICHGRIFDSDWNQVDADDLCNLEPCLNECHHGPLWRFAVGIQPPNLHPILYRRSCRSGKRNDTVIPDHGTGRFPSVRDKSLTWIRTKESTKYRSVKNSIGK